MQRALCAIAGQEKSHHHLLVHTRDMEWEEVVFRMSQGCASLGLTVGEASQACKSASSLCQAGIGTTAPGWAGQSPLGRELEVFAVCSCLLYLETQASRSHKLP